jgi:Protein of unknown function (DUF3800)
MTGTGREPKLEIGGRCLAVFVDETGHEELKGQPVYGLGGCAALGRDIERLLDTSWREVRRRVAGSPNAQLHANGLRPKPGDVEAIEAFFRTHHFWRLGAVITRTTKLPDEMSRVRMMKRVLQNRVKEIVGRSLCKEVAVIFESSQRTDRLIEEAFQDFEVARGSKHIPSTCYFMPKSAADPALEVADFVMHAVRRQARRGFDPRGTFVADFCAVFHTADPTLVSFFNPEEVIPAAVPL